MKTICLISFALALLGGVVLDAGAGEDGDAVILGPETKAVPGRSGPTPHLRYRHPGAEDVRIAGSWDRWTEKIPLNRKGDLWQIDVRSMDLEPGRYVYKFIVDKEWEEGSDRLLYINPDGVLEPQPEMIHSARLIDSNEVSVIFLKPIGNLADLNLSLQPAQPIASTRLVSTGKDQYAPGYQLKGGLVTFYFDEAVYGMNLDPRQDRVTIAGNFNGWNADGGGGRFVLRDPNDSGLWSLTTQVGGLRPPGGEEDILFKFVVNGSQWLSPPANAFNATPDGKGNVNLRLDPQQGGGRALVVRTENPVPLDQATEVVVEGLWKRPLRKALTPLPYLDTLYSEKPLGAVLNKEQGVTTYRVFSPRATRVVLNLYEGHRYQIESDDPLKQPEIVEPAESYDMWKDPADGVWEITLLGLDTGKYFAYQVDGPEGDGEGFYFPTPFGDPYGLAAAHAEHTTIVMDPDATNQWFDGWTDDDWKTPPPEDVVIYETHVRHLTKHPSSGVPPHLQGTYEGVLASLGTGTGLDHIKDMGFNMIEFLPLQEFNNGPDEHDWGYTPVYYFAPEASYATAPLQGSQVYEFKKMVNELHRQGFGVLVDVVYNHVGWPNIFAQLDRKYYFRLNPDFTHSNYSGCGNDVRTEAPMMRRLIIESVLYWMTEFKVDGFRFDLAELIDTETLMELRDRAREINPNVLLISEPWSFRGHHKDELTGTGWSAWNNDFRYAAKDYAMGKGNREGLKRAIVGSVDNWTANPVQAVNYVESHDDMSLADELSTRPDRDGRPLQEMDVAANRITATLLFTSLGIPMIAEGQEFLRSKHGISNTFDQGDEINSLNWNDRDRPLAREAMEYYRGLIHLRQSDPGAAFRVAERAPEGYYRWLEPENEDLLGYIVNAPRIHEGASFIVLVNADGDEQRMNVPFPRGEWRLIGNGREIDPAGLDDRQQVSGPVQTGVRIPGISSLIFMRN